MLSRLISYPLFRLAVALATGIFLSDALLEKPACVPWLYVGLSGFAALAFCLYPLKRHASRAWFGLAVTACFVLLGGILLQESREKVRYGWLPAEAVYVGTVSDVPRPKRKTMQATVRVEAVKDRASGQWHAVGRDILLYWMPDSVQGALRCGDRLCFRARIRRPLSDEAFSGFDYGRYLECQGIGGTAVAFSGNWKRLPGGQQLTFRQEALLLRERVVETYRSWGLEGDVFAVVAALTVGDKSELSRELKATYSAAGASHVLALSGLHIGILTMILSWLLYPLRRLPGGRWMSALVLVGVLWAFAFIAGLSASVVRAVTMFSLYALSLAFTENRFSGFASLSFAAFLMLLCRPLYLFDVSFQLSFVAVLSILLGCPLPENVPGFPEESRRFSVICRRVWKRVSGFFVQCVSISFVAQLGVLPFVLCYFGAFPTYFLLANLVVTPLAVCILGFALASLLLSAVPFAGEWAVKGLEVSALCLNGVMEGVQRLAGSQLVSVYLSFGQAFLLAVSVGLAFVWHAGRSPRALAASLLCLNLLAASLLHVRCHPPADFLYFTREGIYTQRGRETLLLRPEAGLCRVRGLHVALMDDGSWRDKQSDVRLRLDYVYICGGFRGTLSGLSRLFCIGKVVLDGSLGEARRSKLKRECEKLSLPYADISEKGYHAVAL